VFALSSAPAPGLAHLAGVARQLVGFRETKTSVFELPPLPPELADIDQTQLFADDCAQADAPDGEPVFWTGRESQSFPADDYVQADAPDDFPVRVGG
jgi:hypothetical protein